MPAPRYDAIVIGGGHNGLVAAAYLARAGWSTLVLERNAAAGGAVRSGQVTLPGYTHDLYATNLNLFRGSPVAAELGGELERHGLRYATSERPFASLFPEGRALRVHRDRERTLEELARHSAQDADGLAALAVAVHAQRAAVREEAGERTLGGRIAKPVALAQHYDRLAPALFALYGAPARPAALASALASATRSVGRDGLAALVRLLLSSTGDLGEEYLATPEARSLIAAWGMHLDFAPHTAGGAIFPFLETFTDMQVGMSIAQGGASALIDALLGVLREAGGELRADAEVVRVHVAAGRVGAVELASGERIAARRAVIANLTPGVLFGSLLADAPLPPRVRRAAAGYRYGPATLMVHLALKAPVRWSAGEDLDAFAYLHIGPYADDLDRCYLEAAAGLLPREPLLVVGQTSMLDPTRAPEGGHVLWVQVRTVPYEIKGDAAGEIGVRDWESAAEPFADRVMRKLQRYAPAIRDLVLRQHVITPVDLERDNPNLVRGDSLGGSMHLRQNLLLRPLPGLSGYASGVDGLLLVGAATWPGAGVNALSGYHVAQQLIAPRRRRLESARLAFDGLRALRRTGH